jgi:NitT/TauT family transport system substrate-binding protein
MRQWRALPDHAETGKLAADAATAETRTIGRIRLMLASRFLCPRVTRAAAAPMLAAVFAALCGMLAAGAAPASAAETIQTGMIGAANAVGWPWYIGIHKGFFADQGIDLDVVYVPTASGLVQQLSAGSLDLVADVGVVEPIHAVEKGAPVGLLRIVGQVSAYEMLAKPSIATVKDLKGKTICIGGLIDINRVYLERIMQANGLHDGDYDITVVGNTAGRFAALKSGAVDATMLAPPVSFFAEDAGFRNIGMIMDYAGDMPFSGTVVSLAYAKAHGDTLKKVLAVLDQSVAWFEDASHRGEAIDILMKEMKSARDPVERSYDYLRKIKYFAPTAEMSRSRVGNLISAMRALGDIKSDITLDKVAVPGLPRLID